MKKPTMDLAGLRLDLRDRLSGHKTHGYIRALQKLEVAQLARRPLNQEDSKHIETLLQNLGSYPPLAVCMILVENGIAPPPELLILLLEAWGNYLDGRGDVDLEEAFLGKPVRRAGNHARQRAARINKLWIAFEVNQIQRKTGLSTDEAADKLKNDVGLRMEPESIAKIARQWPGRPGRPRRPPGKK